MIRPDETDAGSVSLGRKGGLGMSGTGESSTCESRSGILVEKRYWYYPKIGGIRSRIGEANGWFVKEPSKR